MSESAFPVPKEWTAKAISTGALKVSMQPEPSDAFIIAVPTPINAEKAPVLDSVFTAVRAIAPLL
jgi:UDP-N-acetyl-D-mannosaminuronic acid dehydrogenase